MYLCAYTPYAHTPCARIPLHAHTLCPRTFALVPWPPEIPKLSQPALPTTRLPTLPAPTLIPLIHFPPRTSAAILASETFDQAGQPQDQHDQHDQHDQQPHAFPTSAGFFPPEILLEVPGDYDLKAVDLFALGCVMLELVMGHATFKRGWLNKYGAEILQTRTADRASITALFEGSLRTCEQIIKDDHPSIVAPLFETLLNMDPARRVINPSTAMLSNSVCSYQQRYEQSATELVWSSAAILESRHTMHSL